MQKIPVKVFRLQNQGKRGFAITIPTEWVRKNDLKAGDALPAFITEDGAIEYQPIKTQEVLG